MKCSESKTRNGKIVVDELTGAGRTMQLSAKIARFRQPNLEALGCYPQLIEYLQQHYEGLRFQHYMSEDRDGSFVPPE